MLLLDSCMTYTIAAAATSQLSFNIFKFSDFNKEPPSSLKMI